MANWTIPFNTRSGQNLRIEIAGAATATTLTGAAHPLVISEENEEFAFHPVRLQSGNLSLVIDGSTDWRSILPTSAKDRPVKLYRINSSQSSTLMWQGYIQPSAYDMEMFSNAQEITLPVFCELSTLQGENISAASGHIGNFAELLEDILSGTNYQQLYFTGTDVVTWLKKKCNWSLFYTFNEDTNAYEAKYDKLEILQYICTFFGWVLRSQGESLYFQSDDSEIATAGITTFDMQGLYEISSGLSPSYPDIIEYDELEAENVDLASTDYTLSLLNGKKKVTVESEINPIDSILEVGNSKLEEYGKDYPIHYQQLGAGTMNPVQVFTTERPVTVGTVTYDFGELLLTARNGQGSTQAVPYYYVAPYGVDSFDGQLARKHTITLGWQIEWRPDLQNLHNQNNPYFTLLTKDHFSFSNGILAFSAQCAMQYIGLDDDTDKYGVTDYIPDSSGQGSFMVVSLRVGNKYWNGLNSWSDSFVTFNMPIGTDKTGSGDIKGVGEIISNRTITIQNGVVVNDKPEYDGYGIPISGSLAGQVVMNFHKLVIKNYHDPDNDDGKFYAKNYIYLRDFKIAFHKNVDQQTYRDVDSNKYTVENQAAFTDEEKVDNIFASNNNNKYGKGLIMNEDGTYCDLLPYNDGQGSSNQRPEQNLAERIASFYAKAKKMVYIPIFRATQLPPTTQIVEHDGGEYMQLSQEIDFIENKLTLQIIEK